MEILIGTLAYGLPVVFYAALAAGMLLGIAEAIREKPRQ